MHSCTSHQAGEMAPKITCHSMTPHYISQDAGFSYESAWKYYLSLQKRWYSAAEQHSPVLLTDPDFQTSCLLALPFPARWSKGGDANVQLIYLPFCVFLWTPQQRLRVQPDLFCCTQNLPQFPLWRTDGPAGHSWLSLDDAVLFRGKKSQGKLSTQSWWCCCFLHCGIISWQAALVCVIA